jgi:signal transduction histidine kinase
MSTQPVFSDEPSAHPAPTPWRILVVDDDREVHAVTRLALADFSFEDRPLEILTAASAGEAKELWRREQGIALVLLDVVMETDHAGLDVVRFVRDEQGDRQARIVLRTGQSGRAPALELIRRYEIDDYHTKTELTFERLNVVVTTALRTYRLIWEMEERRLALERSSCEIERFAYIISQDLRSPLRTVASLARLLEQHSRAAPNAQTRELLDRVVGSAREVEVLIGNLLEYVRIRRRETGIVHVDLNQVIEATRRCNQLLMEQRDAVLEYGVLPQLEGDPALLEQLFAELIDNAVRFQPGPRPQVFVKAEDLRSAWEIHVIDHGPGLDPEDEQAVFEPFRRLYRPGRFSGTGIGLAICKRIAEVHGGSIRIHRSATDQCTTVAVILPKVQHHRAAGGF